jgi:hypothetical protein
LATPPIIASAPLEGKIVMKNLIPRLINDVESDRRAVKKGWYAINGTGKLRSGPFANRPACAEYIRFKTAEIAGIQDKVTPSRAIPYWMQQFPN